MIASLSALLAGCGAGTRDTAYFSISPVTSKTSPPCLSPTVGWTGSRDGPVMACFALGPTELDAGDVESAVARPNGTGNMDVVFELTSDGTRRFTAMARTVGLGGQIAIVVDGVIVSVPRLDVTEFSGKGVVSGLDPAAASRLASRLEAA